MERSEKLGVAAREVLVGGVPFWAGLPAGLGQADDGVVAVGGKGEVGSSTRGADSFGNLSM